MKKIVNFLNIGKLKNDFVVNLNHRHYPKISVP